ncbi:hypothetical protein [Urechidicola croceus]|uniref:ABM domain-containing protein n=1 Tax=Urechidicola croceus TaxID=1850246 RepID=A0A1D8P710_9FLAO|nr:hypothetical protein [Urechidicola croceus]AOW20337.1 hypothetical protein LPB138_06435 [Urechidicola croceus]
MKPIKNLLNGLLVLTFMFSTTTFAQNTDADDESSPVYMTLTITHWSGDPMSDFDTWKALEQEYFNKVTSKNDKILAAGVYTHMLSDDSSEVLFAYVYKNWEDIETSQDITNKLIEEAWPNEDSRKAFFEKQSSYYGSDHSDEIYVSTKLNKPLNTNSTEPLIYYAMRHTISSNQDANRDKVQEYFDNVTAKNDYVKGVYGYRHRWGSNGRELLMVQVFENFEDFDKSYLENQKLLEEYMPNEDERKEFIKEMRKNFDGHSDALYENVPELSKR